MSGERKEPEWAKQERLRKERKQRKKGPRGTYAPGPKDYSMGKLVLEVKGSDKDMREVAYDDLMVAQTLRTYFPEHCHTPQARKHSVSLGRLELEGPKAILQQIERELRAGWTRGKIVPKWKQEQGLPEVDPQSKGGY